MSKKNLWCVAIRPEGDSPHEQLPAVSKEIAIRVLARLKKMAEAEKNSFMLEIFDDCFRVQQWHGTRKEHLKKMFYTEDWFKEPMYQCFDLSTACKVFEYGEIVECHKKASTSLITSDFEKAKSFYEVA
ncbi:hypothetical protein KTH44_16090 [Acinetobacter bereziniae]|uniref:hypothetical protein n=1 Tax=Acinetobacter bereziniae TaxID=106648 RepID=UPI0021CDC450|nr:hypothetical protein [Acinetobacter bereziniae]MCU4320638.1 hypothetical protein [Acinetobacter bereziniae]